MTDEQELLATLLAQAEALSTGLDEALQLSGLLPLDAGRMEALNLIERTATTALLKRVEQMEDVMMRLFRTILRQQAVDTSQMFHRDIANQMEKLGLLRDAERWMAVVRLRNRLVHEYPVGRAEQLDRVNEAWAAVPVLNEALAAARNRLSARPTL